MNMLKTAPTTENSQIKDAIGVLLFLRMVLKAALVTFSSAAFVFSVGLPKKEVYYLKQQNTRQTKPPEKRPAIPRLLYVGYMMACMSVMLVQPAAAASTIWEKASEIMQDVYTQILTISTVAAIVTASIALLMMNFSRSGRTVDESRAWLKRIIITWVILNGLGFIMAYITPFFSGGQWSPT